MKHKNWSVLKSQDIVDVIAPGYPSPLDQVRGGAEFLARWDLQARAPRGMIGKHFLHANTDEKRFEFLKAAILAPDSKVIWCTRGGYGSNRMLPLLAKLKKPKATKLLIGLSDITSLHCFFTQEWGWPTLHACVLDRLGRNALPQNLQKELHSILFGERSEVVFKKIKALNPAAQKNKSIESRVVGGNLTVLQSTLGTPYQVQTKNRLLFIEDLGERGYRIDRMLEQFRQAGLFQHCHGLLLGQFIGGDEPATKKNNFAKVFKRWAGDLDIPVFSGIETGHGHIQRALPFNTQASLQALAGSFEMVVQTNWMQSK